LRSMLRRSSSRQRSAGKPQRNKAGEYLCEQSLCEQHWQQSSAPESR